MKISEYDGLTDTTIERDATQAEIKAYESELKFDEKVKAEKEAKAASDLLVKSNLLNRLGITAEEAALLLK
jgi:hypothetical protein